MAAIGTGWVAVCAMRKFILTIFLPSWDFIGRPGGFEVAEFDFHSSRAVGGLENHRFWRLGGGQGSEFLPSTGLLGMD